MSAAGPPGYLEEMPEANYLVGHEDGPYYRLIVRLFFERHRAHVHYLRSDEIAARVREVFPGYDEATCRRHLDQLERWRLIRALPEQSRPATLQELRSRPRTYQAERLTIQLEGLRVRLEQEAAAASINPAALEQLVRRLEELVAWLGEGPDLRGRAEAERAHELWHGVWAAFDAFAQGVEDYLGDLPRHRPKETLDVLGFLGYRDVLVRYLADYARQLFERREYIRHLLLGLQPAAPALAAAVGAVAARQVRADGSRPEEAEERAQAERQLQALRRYFAAGGDVDVLLERAQAWVVEITRHAQRLAEHQAAGTVRAALLLELGRRLAACPDAEAAAHLAQVAFGLTLPLHWRGSPPEAADGDPWERPAVVVPLQPVRRGARQRLPGDGTPDRSAEELERLLAQQRERERLARALERLFGGRPELELERLELAGAEERQILLRLVYRALAQGGRAAVGYRDWTVEVRPPETPVLGTLAGPDGCLTLPRYRLRLERGWAGRG